MTTGFESDNHLTIHNLCKMITFLTETDICVKIITSNETWLMGMIWEQNSSCHNGNLWSHHDQKWPDKFDQMLQAFNCFFNCNEVLHQEDRGGAPPPARRHL
jgi:hypothetical protein